MPTPITPSRRWRPHGWLALALTACVSPAPSPVVREPEPTPRRADDEAPRGQARTTPPAVRTVPPGLGIDRPHAIETWLAYELKACDEERDGERCRPVPDITTDEVVARCRRGCDDAIADLVRQNTSEAVTLCVDRYVREWAERGRASARCTVDPSRPYASRVDRAACASTCGQQGEEKVAALRPAPSKPAVTAPAAATTARGGGGDEHLMCCDGTRSPTCTVGRASYRGCCSHHGGVC